ACPPPARTPSFSLAERDAWACGPRREASFSENLAPNAAAAAGSKPPSFASAFAGFRESDLDSAASARSPVSSAAARRGSLPRICLPSDSEEEEAFLSTPLYLRCQQSLESARLGSDMVSPAPSFSDWAVERSLSELRGVGGGLRLRAPSQTLATPGQIQATPSPALPLRSALMDLGTGGSDDRKTSGGDDRRTGGEPLPLEAWRRGAWDLGGDKARLGATPRSRSQSRFAQQRIDAFVDGGKDSARPCDVDLTMAES
ncbi:hypothetical protein H632_c2839p0, partial [Helicosporidium sp. ATCC 50920]